eukprot:12436330-Alexandrium_andersonii.AAC.1
MASPAVLFPATRRCWSHIAVASVSGSCQPARDSRLQHVDVSVRTANTLVLCSCQQPARDSGSLNDTGLLHMTEGRRAG